MLRHHLLIIYRNFKRHKSSFFINLIGLSTGLACVLLIYMWVNDELSVDKFHEKDSQLFQVMQNVVSEKGIETTENTPALLAKSLSEDMPEVEYSVSVIPTVFNASNGITSVDNFHFKVTAQYVTDDFFKVFSYKLLEGNKDDVLSDQRGIIISRKLASKLFDKSEGIVGKPIEWSAQDIKIKGFVSGVFDDIPLNATNQFDILLNFKLFLEYRPWFQEWSINGLHTYVRLKEQSPVDKFNDKIKGYLKTKVNDPSHAGNLFIQHYSDRYLYGNYVNGAPVSGRMEYVKLLSIIAIFILVIACVNFMNLSTAKASRRISEVCVKKVVGASRKALIFQYLIESMVMAFLSLGIAVLATVALLPPFNEVTGKIVVFNLDFHFGLAIILITLVTALLAGSYPALYLSGLKPVSLIKGKFTNAVSEIWARKGLVVFQFAISIVLIIGVTVVFQQIEFVQSKNLGYNKDQVVHFRIENPSDEVISEIKNIPGVVNASGTFHDITVSSEPVIINDEVFWEGKNSQNQTGFVNLTVGYGFVETMGIQILEGNSFPRDFGVENQIICNEAAILSMGLKDPIGKNIKIGDAEWKIIGVAKNFNFESLHKSVKPCFLILAPAQYLPKTMVRIQAGMEKATLEKLSEFYKTHSSGLQFDYKFLDDDYQRLYASEQKVASVLGYFAGMAIIISCLGLFGLAAFTAERRTKEIGIRKVLGSSEFGIVKILSGDFTKMVFIAIAIALPISFLVTDRWLESFAYHIDLEWWYFASAGVVTLLIAWLTVGIQTVKAALVNPVDTLRTE